MKKNYLFIKHNHTVTDLKSLDYSDIHFWNVCQINNQNSRQNVYFYCKNINEFDLVNKNKHIPHITFMGDSIFSDFYNDTLSHNLERFWFPEKKHLTQDFINKFLSLPLINETPIALGFNPIFQKDIEYEEFFSFINSINSQYQNPLFSKDLSLQENEIFSLENRALIDDTMHYVVLGLFGDYYSLEKPSLQSINFGILKDKLCVTCEFANTCKERGLGFLKSQEHIQSCIGIKLFQQN